MSQKHVEDALADLEQLPPEQRAAIADRLLAGLHLADMPEDRDLDREAEREDLNARLGIQVNRILQHARHRGWTVDALRIDASGSTPRIRDTRITIHSIVDYLKAGWGAEQIALAFTDVGAEDVVAVADYVARNLGSVVTDYQAILARHRRAETPPEVRRKLAASRRKLLKLRDELQAGESAQSEEMHAGSAG